MGEEPVIVSILSHEKIRFSFPGMKKSGKKLNPFFIRFIFRHVRLLFPEKTRSPVYSITLRSFCFYGRRQQHVFKQINSNVVIITISTSIWLPNSSSSSSRCWPVVARRWCGCSCRQRRRCFSRCRCCWWWWWRCLSNKTIYFFFFFFFR